MRSANIIFLFADDQRADTIAAHGNPHIRTPNLDKLASGGFSFRRNYCAGSFSGVVCVASRAMLMTGKHWMDLPRDRPVSNWGDSITLPARLAARGGFVPFIVGKWQNGSGTLNKSFSDGRSIYMGGKVLKALEGSPHAENTIVIYTADHGLAMGSHGLLGKQNVYEQSMQCPLILSGPGVPEGKSSEAFTYVHDLYATVCDFAGVGAGQGIDSQSLVPVMNGKVDGIHESVFLPFQDNQRSVRDTRWKLHVYPKINHRLLFDLSSDPHEMKIWRTIRRTGRTSSGWKR